MAGAWPPRIEIERNPSTLSVVGPFEIRYLAIQPLKTLILILRLPTIGFPPEVHELTEQRYA